MLYSVGLAAQPTPKERHPNLYLKRNLSGVSASPLLWMEEMIGVATPAAILTDASNNLTASLDSISGYQSLIQNYLAQAQGYDISADSTIQSKAQAVEDEAKGVLSVFQNIQSSAQGLVNALTIAQADPNCTLQNAQDISRQVDSLGTQIKSFVKTVQQLAADTKALVTYATSGPGVVQSMENLASKSVSTLTWIVGGGLMAYFLLPSFLPRLAGGVRRARQG